MKLRTVLTAAVLYATPLVLPAQTPGCVHAATGSGIICNFFEGTNGAPSPVYALGQNVDPGYVIWTTHYDTDYQNPQFWSNVLQFTDDGSGHASTAQLFSDPFGSNGTPAFTWSQVTSGAYIFESYSATQPMVYAPSPNTYNVFADQERELTTTPEPSTVMMLGAGLVGLVPVVRRRRVRV